jgi:hypothetical protein
MKLVTLLAGSNDMKATFVTYGRLLVIGLACTAFQTSTALAKEREETHQTYPLTSDGKVHVDNVNGKVHITAWDRQEVQVNAVKIGDNQEDLDAVKIEIHAKPSRVRIHTKYPNSKWSWWGKSNSTKVEYEIKVPAQAQLQDAQTVNGPLEIEGVRGNVHASTVNGRLAAKGLAANSHLGTVNGTVEATFDSLEGVKSVTLKTVNGRAAVELPANADADVSAHTLNGGINASTGLTVKKNWPVGKDLQGKLGNGGTKVRLETINGSIQVRQQDSRKAVLAEQPEK